MDRAWIEIDTKALAHNIKIFRNIIPDSTDIIAVVKANAYGHDVGIISNKLSEIGIKTFAVASIEEAIELRKTGITQDILIFGYIHPDNYSFLIKYNLISSLTCVEQASEMKTYAKQNNTALKVMVAIDSGMHRLGFEPKDSEAIIDCYSCKNFDIKGIYSHLSVSDERDTENIEFTNMQINTFNEVVNNIVNCGFNPGIRHILNSHGTINYSDGAMDAVRLGILMYGIKSNTKDYVPNSVDLHPVLSLKSRIASIRNISSGESVSYGRQFISKHPMKIATVSIGYADGIPRCLSNGILKVIVNNKYAYGLGIICMDQLMIDVSEIDDIKVGDEVTLIGSSGELKVSVEDMADDSNTISYEILSCLNHRLQRIVI